MRSPHESWPYLEPPFAMKTQIHFKFIHFGPRLLMFASYVLQFCLQALSLALI